MSPEHERSRGGNPGSEPSASPTTTTVAAPTVIALSVTRCRHTRDVAVHCPHCGRTHHHGWPIDDQVVGHRLAHCQVGRGYVIEVAS